MGIFSLKKEVRALAYFPQRLEHWPMNLRVLGLIPSQEHYIGCRFYPQWEVIS